MKSHIDCSSGKSTQWKLQTLNYLTAMKSHTDCESGKLTKCKCLITITCWFIHILIYHTIKFNPHIWFNCPEWEIQSFLDPKAGLSAFSSYTYQIATVASKLSSSSWANSKPNTPLVWVIWKIMSRIRHPSAFDLVAEDHFSSALTIRFRTMFATFLVRTDQILWFEYLAIDVRSYRQNNIASGKVEN